MYIFEKEKNSTELKVLCVSTALFRLEEQFFWGLCTRASSSQVGKGALSDMCMYGLYNVLVQDAMDGRGFRPFHSFFFVFFSDRLILYSNSRGYIHA